MATEIMHRDETGVSANKDTLFMLGGVALVVSRRAILTSPIAKRYLDQLGIGRLC